MPRVAIGIREALARRAAYQQMRITVFLRTSFDLPHGPFCSKVNRMVDFWGETAIRLIRPEGVMVSPESLRVDRVRVRGEHYSVA
jgi:hypothetical protein